LKRNKRIELTEDEEVFEQPVEMYNLLENQLIKEEAEEFLNTLIKGLKYPYREVIYLQYHNKLNSRQIAELLRTSPANVRKISSRAREQLKKGMQKKGYTCEYGF
jgi:RNA polymerase sigma-70 factor (ECF subfamily)